VNSPTEHPQPRQIDQARSDLQEGIESSREMVRQTRELIQLTQCEAPYAANDNTMEFSD
jgi:hypothetical protein